VLNALTAGELIRSARCVHYLREFRQHLGRAVDAAAATDFMSRPRLPVWRIAWRPDKRAV
jgi:hypothetical protein